MTLSICNVLKSVSSCFHGKFKLRVKFKCRNSYNIIEYKFCTITFLYSDTFAENVNFARVISLHEKKKANKVLIKNKRKIKRPKVKVKKS